MVLPISLRINSLGLLEVSGHTGMPSFKANREDKKERFYLDIKSLYKIYNSSLIIVTN